jgi:cyclic beta-1,2-glucan synthetase
MTPFAALSRKPSVKFETWHGLGYSRLPQLGGRHRARSRADGRRRSDPVKYSRLVVKNTGETGAQPHAVYGYVEWVLGNNRGKDRALRADAAMTRRAARSPRPIPTASISPAGPASSRRCAACGLYYATSAASFIGRGGDIVLPDAVHQRAGLSGTPTASAIPARRSPSMSR